MIIGDLHSFELEFALKYFWNVVVVKCTLVCDIRLLRFACVQHIARRISEKRGFIPKWEALGYWTKTRNTITDLDRRTQQGAGKRSLLDPHCFTVFLQWAMGCSAYNKTTAVPSVLTPTVHTCCFTCTLHLGVPWDCTQNPTCTILTVASSVCTETVDAQRATKSNTKS